MSIPTLVPPVSFFYVFSRLFIIPLLTDELYIAFRCPWPNCGREFNVNSNMRRHHRNHASPASASSSSPSPSGSQAWMDHHRRSFHKRRRLPPKRVVFPVGDSSVHAPPDCTTTPLSPQPGAGPAHPYAVPSSLASSSISDGDSSVEEISEPAELVDDGRLDNEPGTIAINDDLEARSGHLHRGAVPFQRCSQSHPRSASLGSPPHTPCLSYSPRPHPSLSSTRQEIYTPSPAYAQSALASSRVSTTLRPAFAPAGVKDVGLYT